MKFWLQLLSLWIRSLMLRRVRFLIAWDKPCEISPTNISSFISSTESLSQKHSFSLDVMYASCVSLQFCMCCSMRRHGSVLLVGCTWASRNSGFQRFHIVRRHPLKVADPALIRVVLIVPLWASWSLHCDSSATFMKLVDHWFVAMSPSSLVNVRMAMEAPGKILVGAHSVVNSYLALSF